MNEYLLKVYLLSIPRQPHSLHLYKPQRRVNFKKDSKMFRLLDLLILPTFEHEGHFSVSGNVL